MVDFIESNYDEEQIDLGYIVDNETKEGIISDEYLNIHYLVDIDLHESREAQAAVDMINIKKAIENNENVVLHNSYTITYDKNGELVTINVNPYDQLDPVKDKSILEAILNDI